MEDWLEQMLEKCNKKILQYDSEWNMQTSVCCVPLLKKRGDAVLWNKPQRRLRLSAVARCCPKYKNESSKVSWHTDSSVKNGCDWLRVARLGNSEASDTNRKREKKKPWRKSFARLHIFTSAGGGSSRRRGCYVTCCVAKKTPGSLSADMWRSLIWVRAPCVFQQWWNPAYNILKLAAVYSFIQFCMSTVCTHYFRMYPTSTFSVYVNVLSHFKISHVSRTKCDKVKYKDTFV